MTHGAGVAASAGVEFLVRYTESEGGLAERGGDGALLVLPEHLRVELSAPEVLRVTGDPEVAREDHYLLITTGHPLLAAAAGAVLDKGDIGCARMARAAALPPERGMLEARARDQLHVEHGRLDVTGPPVATDLVVLRAAALVTYGVSVDERVQEVEEIWVECATGQEAPAALTAAIGSADLQPGTQDLALPSQVALVFADSVLATRIARRAEAFQRGTSRRLSEQLRVVDAYYERALESLDERRAKADERRADLLTTQVEATRAEWSRRRAEVTEELAPVIETRPFRLHVLSVPAYKVHCTVRRGAREHELGLTYVPVTGAFLPPLCPSCGASAALVAGKESLGCRSCTGAHPQTDGRPEPGSRKLSGGVAAGGLGPAPHASPRDGAASPAVRRPDASGGLAAPGSPIAPHAAASTGVNPTPAAGTRDNPTPAASTPEPGAHGPKPRARTKATSGRVTPKGTRALGSLETTGMRLAVAFWEDVWSGDLGSTKRTKVVPGSALHALVRLYGAEGPALVIGAGDCQAPVRIATSTEDAGDGTTVTQGDLEFAAGHKVPFTLCWRQGSVAFVEVEAFALDDVGYLLTSSDYYGTRVREHLASFLGPAPAPTREIGPVAAALLRHAAPFLGLAYAARCVAAWWHLSENAADRVPVSDETSAPALAAALERVVLKRSGLRVASSAVAERYECAPEEVRRLERRAQAALTGVAGLRW